MRIEVLTVAGCPHRRLALSRLHANLYCSPEFLAAGVWSDQPGRSVGESAAIGRHTWRDVAVIRHQLIEER
jgi:hypothetical protein